MKSLEEIKKYIYDNITKNLNQCSRTLLGQEDNQFQWGQDVSLETVSDLLDDVPTAKEFHKKGNIEKLMGWLVSPDSSDMQKEIGLQALFTFGQGIKIKYSKVLQKDTVNVGMFWTMLDAMGKNAPENTAGRNNIERAENMLHSLKKTIPEQEDRINTIIQSCEQHAKTGRARVSMHIINASLMQIDQIADLVAENQGPQYWMDDKIAKMEKSDILESLSYDSRFKKLFVASVKGEEDSHLAEIVLDKMDDSASFLELLKIQSEDSHSMMTDIFSSQNVAKFAFDKIDNIGLLANVLFMADPKYKNGLLLIATQSDSTDLMAAIFDKAKQLGDKEKQEAEASGQTEEISSGDDCVEDLFSIPLGTDDLKECTILHSALCNRNADMIGLMLDKLKGVIKGQGLLTEVIQAKDSDGDMPLHNLAYNPNVDVTKKIFDALGEGTVTKLLNMKDEQARTILEHTVGGNSPKVTEYLIEHRSSPEQVEDFLKYQHVHTDGLVVDTAMHYIARSGNVNMLKHIYEKVKNKEAIHTALTLPNRDGETPLHIMASKPNSDMLKFILEKTDDKEMIKNFAAADNCYESNVIHYLAGYGHQDVIEDIFNKIDDNEAQKRLLNVINLDDCTPYDIAVRTGRDSVVSYLCQHMETDPLVPYIEFNKREEDCLAEQKNLPILLKGF